MKYMRFICAMFILSLPLLPVYAGIVIDTNIKLVDVQLSANAKNIRFDDYVPNNLVTADNPSGNGVIARYTSPFTGFFESFNSAASMPVIITDSSGNVIFSDGTSYQVTSDIFIGHGTEDRTSRKFSFVFVSPSDIEQKACISRIAFRTGSVKDYLTVRAYDLYDNQIGDVIFYPEAAAGTSFADEISFRTVDSLTNSEVSVIHRVELALLNPDSALAGTFSDNKYYFDLCFSNPQPSGQRFDEGIKLTEKLQPSEVRLHPDVSVLNITKPGPWVLLSDGSILTVHNGYSYISSNNGLTWTTYNVFADVGGMNLVMSGSKSFLQSNTGVIVLVFMNGGEYVWTWDKSINDFTSMSYFPIYACRSADGGKSWTNFQKIQQGYCGSMRSIIETGTGRIVVTAMDVRFDPGRHVVNTVYTDDDGLSWHSSNFLDIGALGHRGNHEGACEASIVELNDGRLWMIIRTTMDRFYESFSSDFGQTWSQPLPTQIDASSSPAFIKRLASGRLLLVWNRLYPEGKSSYPRVTGQYQEIPASWNREELSIALSSDDGQTWTKPVVIASKLNDWLAYADVLEREQGLLWLTTMQGDLRLKFYEDSFVDESSTAQPFVIDDVATLPAQRPTDVYDYTMNPVDYEFVYCDKSANMNIDAPQAYIVDSGIEDYMNVLVHSNGSSGGTGTFVNVMMLKSFTVDPSVDGAVKSISYSYKQNRPQSDYDLVHLFAIEQNNKYYAYNTFQRDFTNDNIFTTYSFAGLHAESFSEERPDGGFNLIASSHPDFSAGGAPMRFGIMFRMSLSLQTAMNFVTAVDDFNVLVEYEDSPGTAAAFGSADDLEGVAGRVAFKFDDYVSAISPASYTGDVISFFSPADIFIKPNELYSGVRPLPEPVGIYITADDATETQNVRFYDNSSSAATADIYGAGNITSQPKNKSIGYDDLIFIFANPDAPEKAGAVSRVGFRFGNIQALHRAQISFYDIRNRKINMFAADSSLPLSSQSLSRSFIARNQAGTEAAIIHKVVFSAVSTTTYWCVGSHTDSVSKNDMSYYNLVDGGIVLLYPNSSLKRVSSGSEILIQWQCSGIMSQQDSVVIKYYDGSRWVVIDSAAPNTGSYNWTVPDGNIESMKIRVGFDTSELTFGQSEDVVVYQCSDELPDLNNDCLVDFQDLRILLDQWLECGDKSDPLRSCS